MYPPFEAACPWCPHCVKKYSIKYEGKCSNIYCSYCFYTDTTYECQKEVDVDICEYCLYYLNYCFDCDMIFCERSTKHETHKKCEKSDEKLWEQFKLVKKEIMQKPKKMSILDLIL